MISISRFGLWTLTFAFALALPAFAQPKTERKVELRAFSVESAIKDLHVRQNGVYEPLPLLAFEPGPPVQVMLNSGTLEIYREMLNPETKKNEWTVVGRAQVPEAMTRAILVVAPQANAASGAMHTVTLFDDGYEAFPGGRLRLINLSPSTAAVAVGEEVINLSPNQVRVADPSKDAKYRVFIQVAAQDHDGWEVLGRMPVRLPQSRRTTLMVIYSISALKAQEIPLKRGPDGREVPGFIVTRWDDSLSIMTPQVASKP